MKNHFYIIFCLVGGICLGAAVASFYFLHTKEVVVPKMARTATYSNKDPEFSIEYPTYLDNFQKNDGNVIFSTKRRNPRIRSITMHFEPTTFNSTEEWFMAQSPTSTGDHFVPLFWFDENLIALKSTAKSGYTQANLVKAVVSLPGDLYILSEDKDIPSQTTPVISRDLMEIFKNSGPTLGFLASD